MDWTKILQQILPYLVAGGAGMAMDKNNANNAISPATAMAGGSVNGQPIVGVQQRYDQMNNLLTGATGTATTNPVANPNLLAARGAFQTRVNTPVQQPNIYNPYGQQNNQTDWNAMLAKILPALAPNNTPSPIQSTGNSVLMTALNNRFTPRPMVR